MKHHSIRTAVVSALGFATLVAASAVNAGASANFYASSMYLWRGQTLSGAGPAIAGDVGYAADIGLYGSLWTSSEGASGSHETDLNVGFSKKFGDFGIDVGVYEYLYPEKTSGETHVEVQNNTTTGDPHTHDASIEEHSEETDLLESDAAEWYLGVSFGPVSAKLFQNTMMPDWRYLTIDGSFGKFGAHIGMTKSDVSEAEYNDFNVSFTPAENLTFIMSVARGDGAPEEDPLFVVSYKWALEVK